MLTRDCRTTVSRGQHLRAAGGTYDSRARLTRVVGSRERDRLEPGWPADHAPQPGIGSVVKFLVVVTVISDCTEIVVPGGGKMLTMVPVGRVLSN